MYILKNSRTLEEHKYTRIYLLITVWVLLTFKSEKYHPSVNIIVWTPIKYSLVIISIIIITLLLIKKKNSI